LTRGWSVIESGPAAIFSQSDPRRTPAHNEPEKTA
jgi:hypothetical protein